MFRSYRALPAIVLLLFIVCVQAMAAPRVAVFSQPGFPFYMMSPMTSPRDIADGLRRAGLPTDLLDAGVLADPARFNARSYDALVLPYGNTYPREAFANMQAFHRGGGCLILSGIPFTHGVARLSAASWQASPSWGEGVRIVEDAHAGGRALEIANPGHGWVGVNSPRLPIRPGAMISISGWAKDVSGQAGDDDWLYVRFYDRDGNFLSQQGPAITSGADWHRITADVTAPNGAAAFDVSPQVRGPNRTVRLDEISVATGGQPATIANPSFETPGADWVDIGHNANAALFGPNGIGVGGFGETPLRGTGFAVAAGDPLGLNALRPDWRGGSALQPLDTASLPPGVRVVPALVNGGQPIAALLIHDDPSYQGAVDVWAHVPSGGDDEAYVNEQVLMRGVVAALAAKGLLTPTQRTAFLGALDKLPRPKVYANLTLPTPKRPYATFQPKMPPPTRHLYVADVRRLTPDERLLLTSLQGLVNRKQPRLYLVFSPDDRFWLEEMRRQGDTDAPIPVADPLSLVRTFRDAYKGAVIPDPKVYVTPNIAVSIAGANDLLVATPELAQRLGLPIKNDLRGKFADNAAALHYLRTDLWRRLNPYLSICLDPPVLENGSVDQIIAAKGCAFWITGPKAQDRPGANESREMEEVKALLAQMPLGSVVRGFWWHGEGVGIDETPGVALASRFGKVTVVSDNLPNTSVLSGVPATALKQRPPLPPPALDRSKVYVALTISDGDNLCTWRNYFRSYFQDPLHGTFPVGWGMGPTILDVAPTMARYFYAHAAPSDEFLCDVSGVGYIYPPDFARNLKDRDGAMRWFYDWTQTYMDRMDMKTLRLMGVTAPDIAEVGRDLPRVSFLMPDYGHQGEESYSELTYTLPTGQPAFRSATSGSGPDNLASQIRRRAGATRPAFINAFIWNWGSRMSDLKETLDRLGPDYVAVTPSQLNALYRQSQNGR